MKRSKAYRAAAEKIDARHGSTPRSRPSGWPRRPAPPSTTRPSRSPCGSASTRARPTRWSAAPSTCPHGTGKTARVLVFATGEQGRGRPRAAGADDRRLRRPDREGRRRLARLRRRRRDPRPDGQGRPARQGARPAWPDAEPEDRHRDDGRRQGRHRHQGRQDRVPRRQAREPALHHRQGVVRRDEQLVENYAAALDEILRLKPSASKGRYIKKATVATTMGPGIPVDPNRTRNLLVEDDRRGLSLRPARRRRAAPSLRCGLVAIRRPAARFGRGAAGPYADR